MAEFDLIQRYFAPLCRAQTALKLGMGDDAAILQFAADRDWAFSLDTLIGGRHFFTDTDPYRLGHKALAVNLSDLAAMGAQPHYFMLSLSMPEENSAWLQAFSQGLQDLAKVYDLNLIGGDTCQGPLSISIQIIGSLPKGQALLRSAAQIGDDLYISGPIGDAALALQQLLTGQEPETSLRLALEKPQPQVQLGQQLLGLAHACIDLSDGLSSDLSHICQQSSCGAVVNLEQIPLSPALKGQDWNLILSGGDDYQLCFTAPVKHRAALDQLGVFRIGTIVAGNSIQFLDSNGQKIEVKKAYEHFK